MSKRLLAAACLLMFLLGVLATSLVLFEGTLAAPATPTVRYVAPAGSCGGAAPCYAHPQAAIDAASAGDEIRVAAGVYAGVISRGGTTQAVYLDKSITLRGGYKLADWTLDPASNPTTLDAQQSGRVLTISGDIAPVIEGFRLTRAPLCTAAVCISRPPRPRCVTTRCTTIQPIAGALDFIWKVAGPR